ncbi:hypothetical protein OG976_23470 [Mycobacterium sp. NBC_00419]
MTARSNIMAQHRTAPLASMTAGAVPATGVVIEVCTEAAVGAVAL